METPLNFTQVAFDNRLIIFNKSAFITHMEMNLGMAWPGIVEARLRVIVGNFNLTVRFYAGQSQEVFEPSPNTYNLDILDEEGIRIKTYSELSPEGVIDILRDAKGFDMSITEKYRKPIESYKFQ